MSDVYRRHQTFTWDKWTPRRAPLTPTAAAPTSEPHTCDTSMWRFTAMLLFRSRSSRPWLPDAFYCGCGHPSPMAWPTWLLRFGPPGWWRNLSPQMSWLSWVLGFWRLAGWEAGFGNSLVMGGFSWCNETSHLLCDRLSRNVGRIAIYIYLERVRVAALDVTWDFSHLIEGKLLSILLDDQTYNDEVQRVQLLPQIILQQPLPLLWWIMRP